VRHRDAGLVQDLAERHVHRFKRWHGAALHWLEWNDDALRLTVTGENICEQMRTRLALIDRVAGKALMRTSPAKTIPGSWWAH
jgi:hypothetical protein